MKYSFALYKPLQSVVGFFLYLFWMSVCGSETQTIWSTLFKYKYSARRPIKVQM